ncbi:sigma 54-interacting transcriptional regulator [Isosphaeraceae bacterium EP7]
MIDLFRVFFFMALSVPFHRPDEGRAPRQARRSEEGRGRWILDHRIGLIVLSLLTIAYSLLVLLAISTAGSIGLRCVFTTEVKVSIEPSYVWTNLDKTARVPGPKAGDTLLQLDGRTITYYSDYVDTQRSIKDKIGSSVLVRWSSPDPGGKPTAHSAYATVQRPPVWTYLGSAIWFAQELIIFVIGFLVFWKRPEDESASVFFWVCIATVGAYMGGYHWTEIVLWPWMIYAFAFYGILLPVACLHFYLVFPTPRPFIVRRHKLTLGLMYGLPLTYLCVTWSTMIWSRELGKQRSPLVIVALDWVKFLALTYVGVAVALFGLCVLILWGSYRRAKSRAERNQVQYILLASLVSVIPIGYLIRNTYLDPAALGRPSAAWPMFIVSLLYTMGYALSITRYRLVQVENVWNQGLRYFLISAGAGLIYSFLLVCGTLIGLKLSGDRWSHDPILVVVTAIVVLVLSELARVRFQRAIDRRFSKEKSNLDLAMRKMSMAVDRLADNETLGRRLLEAVTDVLRLEWGAIYLSEPPDPSLWLTACHGPEPDERRLSPNNALVVRLGTTPIVRVSHSPGSGGGPDPATDAMIALGGEMAAALDSDGELAGVVVLGPKHNGQPFDDDEVAFIVGLGSVAALAFRSARIQETLEDLNRDLQEKVGKIAEQQRRIMLLQDQLMDRGVPARGDDVEDRAASGLASEVFDRMKGSSPPMRSLTDLARKVAASPAAVLVRGESGTGKELLAEAIHAASPRASGAFVKVHCAALAQGLLESELFGHVKGAFTGADRDRMGRFEQANGGTLFLDEIGDINLEVQTKLLRVLQEMSFERVGSSHPIEVDVRIIAATHQDLERLIAEGRFREDLYYRLNVISLRVPSLRERKDDLFELAIHFLGVHAARASKPVTHLDEDAVEALIAYDWPGNVRELENVIERSVVLADGPAVTLAELPPEVRQPGPKRRARALPMLVSSAGPTPSRAGNPPAVRSWPQQSEATATKPRPAAASARDRQADAGWDFEFIAYERRRLIDVLAETGGNKSEAARLLGMPRSTLVSKLKKHGIA